MAASSKMDEVFQICAKVSGLNILKDFQRDCIKNLICGNDVFVCCKTGSGKFLKCNNASDNCESQKQQLLPA